MLDIASGAAARPPSALSRRGEYALANESRRDPAFLNNPARQCHMSDVLDAGELRPSRIKRCGCDGEFTAER